MAFEAYEGLRPGRKILDLDKGLVIACGLLPLLRVQCDLLRGNSFNSEAPGPWHDSQSTRGIPDLLESWAPMVLASKSRLILS